MTGLPAFEALASALDYPMFVVTTAAGDERAGCLVGFTTQVSIHPERFLVALSDKNRTCHVAARAQRLAVHVLTPDQTELAALFGEATGDDVPKFERCAWEPGPDGVPVLTDAAGWFSGPILERRPMGDHVAHVLAPDSGRSRLDGPAVLSFQDVRGMDAGHAP